MSDQRKPPGKFRSALITMLGGTPVTEEVFLNAIGATNSAAGQVVSEQSMLSLSATWACTRLISETISTLPLNLYERRPNGSRVQATTHPLYNVIHSRPNADTTAAVHWESTIAAMLLRGAGRAEKLRIGDRIVGLKFLVPSRLQPVLRGTREAYLYTETDPFGRTTQREIAKADVFTIPGFSLDGVNGVSVICYGANVFGSALAADQAANSTFKNGLMRTTAFKFPQLLKDNQREQAREAIAIISGALNAGKPAIFEAGMDAMGIGIDPKDAQLLESRAFSVEEICRWFRVPPFMVGHSEKSTSWGTGIEQQQIGFLQFTLRPWLTRVEQAINTMLLTPADQARYYAEFNVDGLLRGDSAARREMYASATQNGWMSRNEVRAKENMPPIDGGDTYTVQTNLIPIDQLGTTP